MEIISVNELNETTVFNLIIPLDELYLKHDPRTRLTVEANLAGMVSPYSLALATLDAMRQNPSVDFLQRALGWIKNDEHRQRAYAYISDLIYILSPYITQLLSRASLTLSDIKVKEIQEVVIDTWSTGYVNIALSLCGPLATGPINSTPYNTQLIPLRAPEPHPVVSPLSTQSFHDRLKH